MELGPEDPLELVGCGRCNSSHLARLDSIRLEQVMQLSLLLIEADN